MERQLASVGASAADYQLLAPLAKAVTGMRPRHGIRPASPPHSLGAADPATRRPPRRPAQQAEPAAAPAQNVEVRPRTLAELFELGRRWTAVQQTLGRRDPLRALLEDPAATD